MKPKIEISLNTFWALCYQNFDTEVTIDRAYLTAPADFVEYEKQRLVKNPSPLSSYNFIEQN